MAISINWATKVISVPKVDTTLVQSSPSEVRSLNINTFRLDLKNLEDSDAGMANANTHNHNTEVTVGGVTLARVVEILSPYTITFEDGQYAVYLLGANSNIADKTNVNQVSIRSSNSAGLITVVSGSGVTPQDKLDIAGAVRNELASELSVIPIIANYTDSIESRLPAALVGGKMDSVAVATITAQDKLDIAAAVGSRVISGTLTADQSQRVLNAILFGKVSGAGTGVETFRNPEDTKNVCMVTADASGNRNLVVLDVT